MAPSHGWCRTRFLLLRQLEPAAGQGALSDSRKACGMHARRAGTRPVGDAALMDEPDLIFPVALAVYSSLGMD